MKSFVAMSLLLVSVFFQDNSQTKEFAIRSWCKGAGKVPEQNFQVKLNNMSPNFERVIKDLSGTGRYKLKIWPERVSERDPSIIAWAVDFVDLVDNPNEKSDSNLLKRSIDPSQDYFTAQDYIWWLYPAPSDGSSGVKDLVPFLAKRIVQIREFDCVFQITEYKRDDKRNGALNSITVNFGFFNRKEGQ